jgi:hypothetical protein
MFSSHQNGTRPLAYLSERQRLAKIKTGIGNIDDGKYGQTVQGYCLSHIQLFFFIAA